MKIYRCGIIGLGRQGAGIPEPYPVDRPRSHKEAYEMHPRCNLVMGVDEFEERNFGGPAADIVSICTPAKYHSDSILFALHEMDDVRAVFCEKPLAPTPQECDEIISLCEQAQVVLAVNHQRAWEEHGRVIYVGDPLETGTHAAEYALRHGMEVVRGEGRWESCADGPRKQLVVSLHGYGPSVSLRSIDDIINCIEGHGLTPQCDGRAGREAVRLALESASPSPTVGFEGGTSGGETRGRSVVLAEAERVSPAV